MNKYLKIKSLILSLLVPTASALALKQPSAIAQSTPPRILSQVSVSSVCSPVAGQWYFSGEPGPIITQYGSQLKVDMSAYSRPTATGRILSSSQIEVTFPDDGTFVGTLNGLGEISWNNGTVWEALNFAGVWKYEGRPGPVITQSGSQLKVNMSAYGRPTATGRTINPSRVSVTFPDDATYEGVLVSPSCIEWSNNTTWTK